jgi:ADP-ribose pyrophosphatase
MDSQDNHNIVYQNKYFSVTQDNFSRRPGHNGTWFTVHRKPADVVVILPITIDHEVIFIKQRRVPLHDKYCLELPAGICDVDNETLEALAIRELQEETGYTTSNIKWLMKGAVSPGILNEIAHLYLATNCTLAQNPHHCDESEDIQVLKVPLEQAWDFYANESLHNLVDCKVGTALTFGLRELNFT